VELLEIGVDLLGLVCVHTRVLRVGGYLNTPEGRVDHRQLLLCTDIFCFPMFTIMILVLQLDGLLGVPVGVVLDKRAGVVVELQLGITLLAPSSYIKLVVNHSECEK
jgi:hypothetical protein